MADYVPIYHGFEISCTASATITGGQPVAVSGNGTVAPAGNTSGAAIGVAGHDAANGGRLTVYAFAPVHESIADGAITAGDQLVTTATANRHVKTMAAAGGATAADINNARAVIGVALTTAADNAKVQWVASH